ncbi:hypothetical protein EBT16_00730 [bacterium]|nr:hypothetical protein [bacterium]
MIDSLWDLPEVVNHSELFKSEPVAIPNPSGHMEIFIMPRDFAEKILAFGLPRDVSEIVEEFKKKPVPRLGKRPVK